MHEGSAVYTDFTNTPSEDVCEVIPEIFPDPDDPDAYVLFYNVFRFDEDDPDSKIVLKFKDGRDLYTVSLKDFIDRYNIRVNDRNEVIIPIRIFSTGTGVNVVDWDIVNVDPGFE